MKTIIHVSNLSQVQLLPSGITSIAHLITYDVACMDGDYTPRVVVYKNRNGIQGNHITQEQLRVLQDAVLNDKPLPEFMKSNGEKAQEILYRAMNSTPEVREILEDTPYVCPILKHQQALQDALQEKFGEKKTYVPKYHIGDTLEFHNEWGKVTKKILEIELQNGHLYYHLTGDNPSYLFCESVDKDTLSIYKVTPEKTYKYAVGDTLEFTSRGKKVIKTITHVGVLYLFGDGEGESSESLDRDTSVRKVTSKPKYKAGDRLLCQGREWEVHAINDFTNHYLLFPVVSCSILDWSVPIDEVDNYKEISTSPSSFVPEFDC